MSMQDKIDQGAGNRLTSHGGRKVFVRGAVAGAIGLILAGAYLAGPTAAVATTSPTSTAPTFAAAPSFADVVARVTPAVVNVAVTQDGAAGGDARAEVPNLPEGFPGGEFFRRFFEERAQGPHGFEGPRHAEGQGSGFVIDPDGYIVTNNHVIDGATRVEVILNDGSRHPATVKGRDPKTDLALLKVEAGRPLPYVELAASDKVRVGDWVLAVGNPFGLGGSVSAGIVSARGRDIDSGPYDDYLQIDAPINRGNSGGPLFDAGGQVIGVNTAIYSPSGGNVGIGFAIPATLAKTVIDQLRDHGQIDRGWLGVQIQSVSEDVAASLGLAAPKGALVAGVLPDSPAAAAGLRPGDLILGLGDRAIDDAKALPRLVADLRAGTSLTLKVQRGATGTAEEVPVVIGRMPGEEKAAASAPDGADSAGPRLGLYLAPLTPAARQAQGLDGTAQGVLVAEVEDGSPAQRAGIRPGDLISMVGQQPVAAPDEVAIKVREAVANKRPSVLLLVEQNGEKRFVTVRLAA